MNRKRGYRIIEIKTKRPRTDTMLSQEGDVLAITEDGRFKKVDSDLFDIEWDSLKICERKSIDEI